MVLFLANEMAQPFIRMDKYIILVCVQMVLRKKGKKMDCIHANQERTDFVKTHNISLYAVTLFQLH